ncbi:methyltransferase family protein [Chloroflexota bacterium]
MIPYITIVVIIILAWWAFRVVARDYRDKQKLSPLSTFIEIAIFFIHACASYIYLDSRVSAIDTSSPLFVLAVILMVIGLVGLLFTMFFRLGWSVSTGQKTEGLRKIGLYRFSRNPQIVTYFLVIAGYALLWPSNFGLIWVCLYMMIAHFMVRTEEEHLLSLYGDEYRQYCSETPRYVGFLG